MSAELDHLVDLTDALGRVRHELEDTGPRRVDPGPVNGRDEMADHLRAPRLDLDPEGVARGLGQLVLTIVELLRQLMERQAIRLMDAGQLTESQEERLGLTFMRLAERMDQLKAEFGLTDADLNLDLGPLGRLM